MMAKTVSPAVVRRLPRYLHQLEELMQEGVTRISSGQLAESLSLTASQVRQDFSQFGGFGQQGYGYNTVELHAAISKILHLERGHTAILVGAGNLGRALCHNFDFGHAGFHLTAAFDIDLSIGKDMPQTIPLLHSDQMETFVRENKPELAVLTLPKNIAAKTARLLSDWGVRGFWNFTGVHLNIPGVRQEEVHFAESLMTLCYYLDS